METKKSGHLRKLGHSAALLFGAYWLVATTAVYTPVPRRECFKGIGDPATLRVVLGARTPLVRGEPPSCQGLDGVAPGGTLTFTLARRPSEPMSEQLQDGACLLRDAQEIGGVEDFTLTSSSFTGFKELTSAGGQFASSSLPGCQGSWFLQLSPQEAPGVGQTISPLDAGPTHPWFVRREMAIPTAELCGGAFEVKGAVGCEDEFAVVSITEVTP